MGIHLHSTAILYTRARISTSLCIKSGEIKRKTTPETFDRGGRQAIRWRHEISRQIEWAGRERLGTRLRPRQTETQA